MSKKEHKVEALRWASVQLLSCGEKQFLHLREEDRQGAIEECIRIGEQLRIKAIKLGGDYNRHTGKCNKKKKEV